MIDYQKTCQNLLQFANGVPADLYMSSRVHYREREAAFIIAGLCSDISAGLPGNPEQVRKFAEPRGLLVESDQ